MEANPEGRPDQRPLSRPRSAGGRAQTAALVAFQKQTEELDWKGQRSPLTNGHSKSQCPNNKRGGQRAQDEEVFVSAGEGEGRKTPRG